MQKGRIRIVSAATAGSLALAAVAITASSGTSSTAKHVALAPQAESSPTVNPPTVNLDNCPVLYTGYPSGGCVAQLQTELNTIMGLNLSADGIFGLTTQKAVEEFQQEHNIVPADGIVGPQTKAALDNPGSSSTGTSAGQLNPGQQITSGTQIASHDGRFVLQMQSDGNLVLRAPGNIPVGDTHTAGHNGTIAVMQTDGNFVLRAPGNIPVWASGTDGHPGTVLQVQDDGNAVLYAPGHQALRVLFPAVPGPPNSGSTPTVPPASATAPAPSATAAAPSSTAPVPSSTAPGTSGGSPVTNNCGYATCSAYLSRSATRAAYEKSTVGGGGFAAVAAVICGALSTPPLTPVGVACFATAALHGPWIVQELSEAATQHGARGACLKVTYTKPPIPPTITWWSTNNGQYCKD